MVEMKAALSGILRRFILKPVDTPHTLEILSDFALRPVSGAINVRFVRR